MKNIEVTRSIMASYIEVDIRFYNFEFISKNGYGDNFLIENIKNEDELEDIIENIIEVFEEDLIEKIDQGECSDYGIVDIKIDPRIFSLEEGEGLDFQVALEWTVSMDDDTTFL